MAGNSINPSFDRMIILVVSVIALIFIGANVWVFWHTSWLLLLLIWGAIGLYVYFADLTGRYRVERLLGVAAGLLLVGFLLPLVYAYALLAGLMLLLLLGILFFRSSLFWRWRLSASEPINFIDWFGRDADMKSWAQLLDYWERQGNEDLLRDFVYSAVIMEAHSIALAEVGVKSKIDYWPLVERYWRQPKFTSKDRFESEGAFRLMRRAAFRENSLKSALRDTSYARDVMALIDFATQYISGFIAEPKYDKRDYFTKEGLREEVDIWLQTQPSRYKNHPQLAEKLSTYWGLHYAAIGVAQNLVAPN